MKDTKQCYNFFRNFFNFFRAVQLNGVAEDEYGKAIKTLVVSSPQGLKSFWAALLKGSVAKRDTYPCHCCDITSNELAHPKILSERCQKCIETNRVRCYHWDDVDNRYINVSLLFYSISYYFILEIKLLFNTICKKYWWTRRANECN